MSCGFTASTTVSGVSLTALETPRREARAFRPDRLDRLGDDDLRGFMTVRQPALEDGAAHLAATDQKHFAHVSLP